jgi:hypothetical protein
LQGGIFRHSALLLAVFGDRVEQSVIPAQTGTQYSAAILVVTGFPLAGMTPVCDGAPCQPNAEKLIALNK